MVRFPSKWRVWTYRLQILAFLAVVSPGTPQVMAAPLSTGVNWTPGGAPPGETPQSALARMGGSVYREYGNPWTGDTDRARMRLVRYGQVFQTPNAQSGSTWQLGNEINLQEQDNAVRSPAQADQFAAWYRGMYAQIKAFDPQAKIIGPSVWNWNGAGSGCCVTGQNAYEWFVAGHVKLYGTPPLMDFIAVQVYPWSPLYWDDPQNAVNIGLQQVSAAQSWSGGRWPVVVTEWGMLRKPFFSCTDNPQQTEQERSLYTSGMLNGMRNLGVPLALYYGSHEQVPCDGNGWMSWLINRDGSLTVEGLAHTGVVIVPLPTPVSSSTATRVRELPSLTPAGIPTATPTVPSTSTMMLMPSPTSTRTATLTLPTTPTPTLVPSVTASLTPLSGIPPCLPGRRCPPTPIR